MNLIKLKLMGLMVGVLLLIATPVLGQSGTFSIGAFGGLAISVVDSAVEGDYTTYPDTEFKSSGVYGGSIMYRFPSGFALELSVERLSKDLEELGENFGTLNMTPCYASFESSRDA